MSEQLRGRPCLSHPHGSCSIANVDYLVFGTPCNPFSTQRPKRFADGSVKSHQLAHHTFQEALDMLQAFEPPTATMEQTEGFGMREDSSTDTTPLERPPASILASPHAPICCYLLLAGGVLIIISQQVQPMGILPARGGQVHQSLLCCDVAAEGQPSRMMRWIFAEDSHR